MFAGILAKGTTRATLRLTKPRSIWTAAATISAKTSENLESSVTKHLNQVVSHQPNDKTFVIFSLSKNVSIDTENKILDSLRSQRSKYMGCLCDPPRNGDLLSFSYAIWQQNEEHERGEILCPDVDHVRPQSLGREIWKSTSTNGLSSSESLVEENNLIQRLKNQNKSEWFTNTNSDLNRLTPAHLDETNQNAKYIFVISPRHPQQLMKYLDSVYPKAHKLGLIASSTVFERNGRECTIFSSNGSEVEQSSKSVIFALFDDKVGSASVSTPPSVSILNLEPLGDMLQVTKSGGNIINSFSSSVGNATKTLQAFINSEPSLTSNSTNTFESKEQKFFIGIKSPVQDGTVGKDKKCLSPDDCDYVVQVLSGSTSRGTVAANTNNNIYKGSLVQFFQQSPQFRYDPCNLDKPTMTLLTANPDDGSPLPGNVDALFDDEGIETISNNFLSSSSYGTFVSNSSFESRECPDEGTILQMKLF